MKTKDFSKEEREALKIIFRDMIKRYSDCEEPRVDDYNDYYNMFDSIFNKEIPFWRKDGMCYAIYSWKKVFNNAFVLEHLDEIEYKLNEFSNW